MTEQEREDLIENMMMALIRARLNWLNHENTARALLAVAEPVIREQADIALREENARLREENDAWRMDGGSCAGEVKRLRAENARLRVERDKAAEEMWKASDQAQAFRKIIERMPAQSAIVKLAEQQAEIDHLREENARLLKALKPFAMAAYSDADSTLNLLHAICSLTLDDFRRARTAIREGGQDENKKD